MAPWPYRGGRHRPGFLCPALAFLACACCSVFPAAPIPADRINEPAFRPASQRRVRRFRGGRGHSGDVRRHRLPRGRRTTGDERATRRDAASSSGPSCSFDACPRCLDKEEGAHDAFANISFLIDREVVSTPFRVGRALLWWDSHALYATVVGTLLREVLGVDVVYVNGEDEVAFFYAINHCMEWWKWECERLVGRNWTAAFDTGRKLFRDPLPDVMWLPEMANELITPDIVEGTPIQWKARVGVPSGITGYLTHTGLYVMPRVAKDAWDAFELPLTAWRSLTFPDLMSIMDSAEAIIADGMKAGYSCDVNETAGLDEALEMLAQGWTCEEVDGHGWWVSPGCRASAGPGVEWRRLCVVAFDDDWGWTKPDLYNAISTLMVPIVRVVLGYDNYYLYLAEERYRVTFFWWIPDTQFARLKPDRVHFEAGLDSVPDVNMNGVWAPVITSRHDISFFLTHVTLSEREIGGMMNAIADAYEEGLGTDDPEMEHMQFPLYEKVACDWIRENTHRWRQWLVDKKWCLQGQYFDMITSRCELCPPGTKWHLDKEHDLPLCKPCLGGTFSSQHRSLQCEDCRPGTFAAGEGFTECLMCGLGTYMVESGQSECRACGDGFVSMFIGASSPDQCTCDKGRYYAEQGVCVECGEGLDCVGDREVRGDSLPMIKPGYMVKPLTTRFPLVPDVLWVYKCEDEDVCPGGTRDLWNWTSLCGTRRNIACSTCPPGTFAGESECIECSHSLSLMWLWAGLSMPLVCLGLYLILNRDAADVVPRTPAAEELTIRSGTTKSLSGRSLISRVISDASTALAPLNSALSNFREEVLMAAADGLNLMIQYLQLCGLVGKAVAEAEDPPEVSQFIFMLGEILDFNFEIVLHSVGWGPSCLFGSSALQKYMATLALPLVVAIFFVCNYLLYVHVVPLVWGHCGERTCLPAHHKSLSGAMRTIFTLPISWDLTVQALGALITAFYIGSTSLCLMLFVTYDHPVPSGTSSNASPLTSVRRYPSIIYGDRAWWTALPIACAGLLVYMVGVMAWAFWVCLVAPSRAHDPHFLARYHFLFCDYRPSVWWWGSVMLVKGLAMNLCLVLIHENHLRCVGILFVSVLFLCLTFKVDPWPRSSLNVIDSTWGFSICLAISLILTRYTTIRTPQGRTTVEVVQSFESVAFLIPVHVTMFCLLLPIGAYCCRRRRAVRTFYFGQCIRDVMLLVARKSNREINQFLSSLDDHDRRVLRRFVGVICARMFKLQPGTSLLQQTLISDVECFQVATPGRIINNLEHALDRGERDLTSMEERGLVQWYLEQLIEGYSRRVNSLPVGARSSRASRSDRLDGIRNIISLPRQVSPSSTTLRQRRVTLTELFQTLDPHRKGTITKEDFVRISSEVSEHIHREDAQVVFEIVDTDEDGALTHKEFDVIFAGMAVDPQKPHRLNERDTLLRIAMKSKAVHPRHDLALRQGRTMKKNDAARDIQNWWRFRQVVWAAAKLKAQRNASLMTPNEPLLEFDIQKSFRPWLLNHQAPGRAGCMGMSL